MKKAIIIFLSFVPIFCYGQIDINKAFEAIQRARTESSIVESSVMMELSIIRQQYRLERDGKTYGKNNLPYYGETYSLGIKITNGMIVSNSVIEPWKSDEDYLRLNSSGQYQPELFWTYQRALDGTEYCDVDLEFGTEYLYPVDVNSCLYLHEDSYGGFGLGIDDSAGEKSGYMIWASTNTSHQDSTMTVSLQQNAMNIIASADSSYIDLEQRENEIVLGGLYVVPKYERGGRIQLMLVGVAVQNGDSGKWSLALLTRGSISKKENAASEKIDNDAIQEPTLIEESEPAVIEKKKKK